jgi:hypothetical protein
VEFVEEAIARLSRRGPVTCSRLDPNTLRVGKSPAEWVRAYHFGDRVIYAWECAAVLCRSEEGWLVRTNDWPRACSSLRIELDQAYDLVTQLLDGSPDCCSLCARSIAIEGRGEPLEYASKRLACRECTRLLELERSKPYEPEPCTSCSRPVGRHELVVRSLDDRSLTCAVCRNRTEPLPLP